MIFKAIVFYGRGYDLQAEDKGQWLAVVNTAKNFGVQ